MKKWFSSRFSTLVFFNLLFVVLSFILRLSLALWVTKDFDWHPYSAVPTFIYGTLYDIAVVSCFSLFLSTYFLLIPRKWQNSWLDRFFVFFFFTLFLIIVYFTFFAEITFWDEFKSRFNFIAVDYLIYTYEVVKNIEESYPLPLLISGILTITVTTLFIARRLGVFKGTFFGQARFKQRFTVWVLNLAIVVLTLFIFNNDSSSISSNRYNNEVSKAGIFSFFSAFRNNHLKYEEHYETIALTDAFNQVKTELRDSKTVFDQKSNNPLRRTILAPQASAPEQKPNIIFVMMESMSASFMQEMYNDKPITPNLNRLSTSSVYFSNMFANGTRTVRGMEAVTLSIPPTPGNSIVKRIDNQNLFTVATVFKNKGYENMFFYGGDGYFDNMNAFFGGNGFDIYDRGRGSILSDQINTKRYNISDQEVTFENAWGIADDDIYNKVIQVADQKHQSQQPFFAFVMTTSNHKPYTYGEGKIDIPSGSGRAGAVKYADYAIGHFLIEAQKKPWFDNTVFVFIADHCASSAGKDAIDVKNHHIPAFIYNLKTQEPVNVSKEVSQIDIFPTLFSLLNWKYVSQFYGKDVFDPLYESRSFVGTYIKLGMKRGEDVFILSDQKKANQYIWRNDALNEVPAQPEMKKSSIAHYQTADYLFSHHLLNEK